MEWERGYLKATGIWYIVVALSIAFLYFDKPSWAVILWLAQISYQLILVILLFALRPGKNDE
jgi:hypothetical protein